jgi:hypothetical protein
MPWLRHFALFLVFVTALFRPAAAGAFVSAPDAGPQARVGAFELVADTLVGPPSAATCGLHDGIGAAYDENASGYRFAARGAGGAPKLLGQPITWGAKDLARVISKHGPEISGKGGMLKSRFNAGEDIAALIKSGTHQQALVQEGSRNMIRTFDAGRVIGTDVVTGGPTSIMNVVTSPSGRLVTAFPGTP